MGHIGLTPQSINTLGSFRAQGREEGSWEPIENDALAVAQAGAFSVVVEAVAEPLARKITETIAIPTIGIGASAACDGQVLVLEDMLGLSPRTPKFVRRYGDLGPMIEAAIEGYATDVRSRAFPGPEHVYGMKTRAERGRHGLVASFHSADAARGALRRSRGAGVLRAAGTASGRWSRKRRAKSRRRGAGLRREADELARGRAAIARRSRPGSQDWDCSAATASRCCSATASNSC